MVFRCRDGSELRWSPGVIPKGQYGCRRSEPPSVHVEFQTVAPIFMQLWQLVFVKVGFVESERRS